MPSHRDARSACHQITHLVALVGVVALAFAAGAMVLVMPSPCQAQSSEGDALQAFDYGIIVTASAKEAEDVLKQLKAGMDFAVLAREKSIDSSAGIGGYLGRLAPSQLRQDLQDSLNGLKAGQFTPVIKTRDGFSILTVFRVAPPIQDADARRIQSLISAGTVHTGLDIAGITEANDVFTHFPKPDGWNRDLPQVCAIRKQSIDFGVDRLKEILATDKTSQTEQGHPVSVLRSHLALAQLYAYTGKLQESIEQYNLALEIAQAGVPEAVPYLEETIGAAYFHLSEMENGAYRGAGEQDLFPPTSLSRPIEKQEESKLAIENFLKYLDQKPDDLQARWLLNLAYASLGKYPAGVPEKYLISPGLFQSAEQTGRFKDVAQAVGLDAFVSAGGLIVDDFDNDGLLDVMVSSMDACDALHFYHNNGDGTFSDRTAQAGLSGQLGGLNILQADYNNDGCMDLLVLRGGWEFPVRRSLLKNNCDGTFTDATEQSGLGGTVTATQTAVWADIDNDGYLDLFVANEEAPAQLFRNRGDGTFEDISHAAGIDKTNFSKGVTAADYDNDGYVDFYVSNRNTANYLYRNNHNGTFTEVALQAGVQAPVYSFATWFFDYDNDGWPDLFVAGNFISVDEVVRSYLELPPNIETLKLYRNKHDGTFEDVTAQTGLNKVMMPMGSNFGDVDNDGYLDLYLGNGLPSFGAVLPHVLLRNDGGKRFVDVTAASGTGELHKGHGIAFADLERNGQMDIVSNNGGAVPSDKHTLRLFENPGNSNDWINLRLVGVKSNRAAVGARVSVTVENGSDKNGGARARTIYRTVGETSSFGGNPMELHIGLGPEARITGVDIWWPASKTRQHFSRVDKDQFLQVKEFAGEYTKLDRPPVRLAAARAAAVAKAAATK